MIEDIKELRFEIDAIAELVSKLYSKTGNQKENGFFDYKKSKEVKKSYDCLILAKAWLGEILGIIGDKTPYFNDGKRKSLKDINDTAEKASEEFIIKYIKIHNYNNLSILQKIDLLREIIKSLLKRIPSSSLYYIEEYNKFTKNYSGNLTAKEHDSYKEEISKIPSFPTEEIFVYGYINEARMWLGFELARFKKQQNRLQYREMEGEGIYEFPSTD